MMRPTEQDLTQWLQAAWPAPSPRLGQKLARAPWTRHAVVRRRAAAVLAAVGACLLLAFSPQGRAIAQSLFTFFVPAPATAFVLPPQPLETLPATITPASQVAPNTQLTGFRRYSSIELAQGLVDFHIYHLDQAPPGFLFRDIGIQHDKGYVITRYDAAGGGGYLWIFQSTGPLPSTPWMQVPAEAIEKVTVAGLPGEYAQGAFVVYANATSAVWEPSASTFRLRWGDGTTYFSIEKLGNMPVMTWLDKAAMIELAADLMDGP